MACECRIAGLFEIGFEGIISAQITGSSEFIEIVSECDAAPNVFSDVRRKLKGPSTGTLNITAYAFEKGAIDKFLGTSCPSSAGISFPTQKRFDCENNRTVIIPTKTGGATREGDPIAGITLLGDICFFRTVDASAASGPATRITDTDKFIGSDLIWTGPPFAFDSTDEDTLEFNILGLDVKLTSFNVSVAVPGIATNTYNFEFSIESCSGDLP